MSGILPRRLVWLVAAVFLVSLVFGEQPSHEEEVPKKNTYISSPEGHVVELTTETFDQEVANGPWFIEFFAP